MPANCSSLSSSTGKRSFLLLALFGLVFPLDTAQAQQHSKIEVSLKQEVRRNPADFRANNRLGEYYARHGDYRNAVNFLGTAYRLNAADYGNAYDFAQAELQAGNAAGAGAIARKLLVQQDRPELHNLLGDCEEANGNFREAANQYQIAARADPSEANLFSFGSELLRHAGYREAGQVLSYAAGRFPQSGRIRVALGVAQYSVGDYRTAVQTLCGAVDLNPADTRAFDFLGKMIGVAPELSSEVAARLKRFATAYPHNAAANYYYAMSLLAASENKTAGADDLARHLLEHAVAESPSFAEAHYQLAILLEQHSENKRAIEELERAVRLNPHLAGAHYRLARLYRRTGQSALAEREYEAVKNARER